ncbi:MAG TPA: dienelactone hydrolase family protein [Thermoanaerobaculia bacterium]|jgi:predicted esterase|nr:dienelactone hydrolase family protein [Thermoanaerobaculia bacterium]
MANEGTASAAVRGPHQGQPVVRAGASRGEARAAVLLLHGRGADAEDILGLAEPLWQPGVAYLAPQAAGHTWYPQSFLAPLAANEPWLSSALARVGELMTDLATEGLPAARVLLAGFSQGACLTLEYAARHARRYGGIVAFTGGLIGPPATSRDYAGSFDGTPAFIGAGDPDPHVPWSRVEESAAVLTRLGADVEVARYPGLGHAIAEDELAHARDLLARVIAG